MNRHIFILLANLFLSSSFLFGQNNWTAAQENLISITGKRQIIPQKYLCFSLQENKIHDKLFSAPHEKNTRLNVSPCIIELPLPNGNIEKFRVVESPVMAEELSAAYPNIKTFSVKGIDNPYASGKLDWNEFGFHGMIFSPEGDFFIDPYCLGNIKDYIVYYTSDFKKDPQHMILEMDPIKKTGERKSTFQQKNTSALKTSSTAPVCIGDTLRTYRLAIACTGEYAIAATGSSTPTIPQTLSKIVTSANRVDGVFEKEVDVRMVLVATETNVIFTDPSTDPFSGNNNANTLITESQSVITSYIGSANYDFGHTFSTGGGGYASLGVVCTSATKAMGITGSSSPVGDPYDIDYVAHEMGHQFNANHSFNAITGSCNGNRAAQTAVEPGSGVTIMGYAGICSSNDLSSNSIPYFHGINYNEIILFTTQNTGNSCPVKTATGNHNAQVSGAGNYTVPFSTPFVLTGSALDGDGDPITYSWEEVDIATSADNWNSGNAPFFRSYVPKTSPSRYFPVSSAVLSGNYTGIPGEYMPQSAQTLHFRLTVRDNLMGGGGICYSEDEITVANAGPLSLTYPSATGISWGLTQTKTITWDVNKTDLAPVSCNTVNIFISYDGGSTYSVLVGNTPNDGSETIPVPTVTTVISTCRIKVESVGNVFYDVSNNNFTISTDVTAGLNSFSDYDPFHLSVWPNPFKNSIQLSTGALNSQSKTEIRIIDLLGKTILYTSYLNKDELQENIDVSTLSEGVYFLQLSNDNKLSVCKIVKE